MPSTCVTWPRLARSHALRGNAPSAAPRVLPLLPCPSSHKAGTAREPCPSRPAPPDHPSQEPTARSTNPAAPTLNPVPRHKIIHKFLVIDETFSQTARLTSSSKQSEQLQGQRQDAKLSTKLPPGRRSVLRMSRLKRVKGKTRQQCRSSHPLHPLHPPHPLQQCAG